MAKATLFRTLTVPAVSTGDPIQTAVIRRNNYYHAPAVRNRYNCDCITRDGWRCGKNPTGRCRIEGEEYSLCSQHGASWLDGRSVTVVTEIVRKEV